MHAQTLNLQYGGFLKFRGTPKSSIQVGFSLIPDFSPKTLFLAFSHWETFILNRRIVVAQLWPGFSGLIDFIPTMRCPSTRYNLLRYHVHMNRCNTKCSTINFNSYFYCIMYYVRFSILFDYKSIPRGSWFYSSPLFSCNSETLPGHANHTGITPTKFTTVQSWKCLICDTKCRRDINGQDAQRYDDFAAPPFVL